MRVVHCKIEKYDVYIGRPGKWGNPYSHKDGTLAQFKCATVEESIQKFKEWVVLQPELMASLHELEGKTLGCWCKHPKKPSPCHGDVLVELVESQINR